MFYQNLENSPFQQLEVERYRMTVCKNTISKLDSNNNSLTEESLMVYLKENWIKYYHVFKGTHETLKELSAQYKLIMVTNGFNEIQRLKVDFCNIKYYFQDIIVASQFGCGKLHEEFYLYALKVATSMPEECIMMGDSIENDIIGANNVGINTIFIPTNSKDNLNNIKHITNSHTVDRIEDIMEIINLVNSNKSS